MMAATLAQGITKIVNAAREPEISDLGHCLIAMGAKISGLGSSEIIVEGVTALNGAQHRVMPDRIETGTYAIAAAIAGGDVELVGALPETIASLLSLLTKSGAEVTPTPRGLKSTGTARAPMPATSPPRPFRAFLPTSRPRSWRCWRWRTALR